MSAKKIIERCDLGIATQCENGRYKFWLNDREFVLVCAECLGVLVRDRWATDRMVDGWNAVRGMIGTPPATHRGTAHA